MDMVKKWASCIVSFLAGVLALALSACSGMVAVAKTPLGKETSTTKAFKILTDADLMKQAKELKIEDKFTAMKVFSIIMLVVAVLLLVYSIVMLLKNVNVIKAESKIFAIVGFVLAALFLIATIGVLVSSIGYANALDAKMSDLVSIMTGGLGSFSAKIGFYQPFMLATSIVTAGTIAAFEIKNVK